jgi:hypothetical protein
MPLACVADHKWQVLEHVDGVQLAAGKQGPLLDSAVVDAVTILLAQRRSVVGIPP